MSETEREPRSQEEAKAILLSRGFSEQELLQYAHNDQQELTGEGVDLHARFVGGHVSGEVDLPTDYLAAFRWINKRGINPDPAYTKPPRMPRREE